MADEAPATDAIDTPAMTGDDQPQVATLAQYVKDLSVENPSAPAVFQWQAQPALDVQFNMGVNQVGEDVHELVMQITVKATSDQGTHFVVDLAYGGLFMLRGMLGEAMTAFLLVEAPRLLFPFARQKIADATTAMGFPALLLDPIDFASAYMAQLQAEQGGAPADPVIGNA